MKKGVKIFLFICMVIYLYQILSFSEYNIRPVKECSKFLKRTYGRRFQRAKEPVAYYMEDGYHTWKIKYIDDVGRSFYEYYRQPYESIEDGFYPCFVSDQRFVCDYYWQQQIQSVYGEKFNLGQYQCPEPNKIKYVFEITDENDIEEVVNIISVTLKYTFDNFEIISENMLGYSVTYDRWPIYSLYRHRDMEDILGLRDCDEEDIYQYIYNQIHRCYQKEVEKGTFD